MLRNGTMISIDKLTSSMINNGTVPTVQALKHRFSGTLFVCSMQVSVHYRVVYAEIPPRVTNSSTLRLHSSGSFSPLQQQRNQFLADKLINSRRDKERALNWPW